MCCNKNKQSSSHGLLNSVLGLTGSMRFAAVTLQPLHGDSFVTQEVFKYKQQIKSKRGNLGSGLDSAHEVM